jgi:Putative transposase
VLTTSFDLEPTLDGAIFGQDMYFLGFPFGDTALTTNFGDNTVAFIRKAITSAEQRIDGATVLYLDGHTRAQPNGWQGGGHKRKVMRVEIAEFVHRFLLHVLQNGFHRIRHYGLLANGHRARKLTLCRSLLAVPAALADCPNDDGEDAGNPKHEPPPCECCGGRVRIIQTFDGSLNRPYPMRKLDGLKRRGFRDDSTRQYPPENPPHLRH